MILAYKVINMSALKIAENYFKLSNESNLDEIYTMLHKSSTFCSSSFDIFVGADEIIKMQRLYHGSFNHLEWIVKKVTEIKPSVVKFDFDFLATDKKENKIRFSGIEYVVILGDKIQHIQVCRI